METSTSADRVSPVALVGHLAAPSTGLDVLRRVLLGVLTLPLALASASTRNNTPPIHTASAPAHVDQRKIGSLPPRLPSPSPILEWTPLASLAPPCNTYLVARHKSTVRITLNRPSKGNALSLAMVRHLTALFQDHIHDDPSIHRVIITGKGKYFCTGMDLGLSRSSSSSSALEEDQDSLFSPTAVPQHARLLAHFFHALDTCPKQTIALLNGPAFGGGVGLLTVCDIRLVSASLASDFYCCLSEVRLGLCPATIARYLVREWGPSLARMAMVSGRRIGSEMLLRAGILHGVLSCGGGGGDDEEEEEGGLERAFVEEWLLKDLRFAAPEAVAMCKRLVRRAEGGGESDDAEVINSDGVKAFEDMLLRSRQDQSGKMSEARVGVGLFRKGVKGVVWEDLDVEKG